MRTFWSSNSITYNLRRRYCYIYHQVETVNDAYLVVSGLPKRNDSRHAMEIADMSLNMLKCAFTFQIKHWPVCKGLFMYKNILLGATMLSTACCF